MSIGDILDGIIQLLPVPKSIFEFLWAGIGWQLGNAFANDFDQDIEDTPWFESKSGFLKKLIIRVFHFTHHWWVGGLLLVYCGTIQFYPNMLLLSSPELFWFGLGLFLEDVAYHVKMSTVDGKISKVIPKKEAIEK